MTDSSSSRDLVLSKQPGGALIAEKAKHALDPYLKQYGIEKPMLDRFKVVVDVSNSMNSLFESGFVQNVTRIGLTMAHRLLKNDLAQAMTVGFGLVAKDTGVALPQNYGSICDSMRGQFRDSERGTNFLPPLELAVGGGQFSEVIFVNMITDGENENGSNSAFAKFAKGLSTKMVFVQLTVLGGEIDWLKELSANSPHINVSFFPGASSFSEEGLYKEVLGKFSAWCKATGIQESKSSTLRNRFPSLSTGPKRLK